MSRSATRVPSGVSPHSAAALEERRAAWQRAGEQVIAVQELAEKCVTSLRRAGQVVFCGNGGSAAMAEHLAAELLGRGAGAERAPLAARALSGSSATLTALGNDLGYETIFSRQVEGVCRAGDVLVALSTSGRSPNILRALEAARQLSCVTVLFTGQGDAAALPGVDHLVRAPARSTSAIQELHLFYGHLLCELVENAFRAAARE